MRGIREFSDAELERAAKTVCAAFLRDATQEEPAVTPHVFSDGFEQQMEGILCQKKFKRRHYKGFVFRRVACLLLSVVIAATVWLGCDQRARAFFSKVMYEIYDNYTVYIFNGAPDGQQIGQYTPGWLPAGYTAGARTEGEDYSVITFDHEETKDSIVLGCYKLSYERTLHIIGFDTEYESIKISKRLRGTVYRDSNRRTQTLVWFDEETNTGFILSASLELPTEQIVRIANNLVARNQD